MKDDPPAIDPKAYTYAVCPDPGSEMEEYIACCLEFGRQIYAVEDCPVEALESMLGIVKMMLEDARGCGESPPPLLGNGGVARW